MIQVIKLYKRDFLSLAALTLLVLGLVLIITDDGNIFASTTDWAYQHSAFLEYFRQLFYKNGELLPSFAANIGCGQNIFNFAYYGLLSPYVLIYFLLPFVQPVPYVITVSIASALASVLMVYAWFRRERSVEQSLFLAAILALSSPFLFHSHRHVMFVIYMPFLIGALFAADRYIKKKKFDMLVVMAALIIFTSFYYSPEALLCILILSVYRFMKLNRHANIKTVIAFAVKICLFIALAIGLAAVLLLPTAYALFSGRGGGGDNSFELSYLIPQVQVTELLYEPYSLGLGAVFVVALIAGLFCRRKHVRFLSAAMCPVALWPAFVWAANGTLYLDGKILIPFLPAAVTIVAEFLDQLPSGLGRKNRCYIIIAASAISGVASVFLFGGTIQLLLLFVFDICATAIFIYMSSAVKNLRPLVFYILCMMLCTCLSVNFTRDTLLKNDDVIDGDNAAITYLSQIAQKDKSNLWRIGVNTGTLFQINRVASTEMYKTTVYSSSFNRAYNNCFYDIFNCEMQHRNSSIQNTSLNILFNTFTAQRYMISEEKPGAGYSALSTDGEYTLWVNENTLPFAWFTDRTLSSDVFESLSYPKSAEALIKYAVCENGDTDSSDLTAREITFKPVVLESENLSIKGDLIAGVTVTAKKDAHLKLSLSENEYNVVFIRFTLDPSQKEWQGDRAITINGIKNKLTSTDSRYHNGNYTFDYVISSDSPVTEFDISFTRGVYNISDFEFYTLDLQSVKETIGNVTALEVDTESAKGDSINGRLTAPDDGKLVFSIPYDRGFTITVDGVKTEYRKANGGFICIDMSEGEHTVQISYRSPGLDAGIAVSGASVLIFAFVTVLSYVRRRTDREN